MKRQTLYLSTILKSTYPAALLLLFLFASGLPASARQPSPCRKEKTKVSPRPLVIKNATIIDGTGAAPRSGMAVLIRKNRIAEVAPAKDFVPPKGARIIDAEDGYVIPGLWDMHIHLKNSTATALPVFIATGVTSVRDMVGEYERLAELRRKVETGEIIGPRIKLSGPSLESPESLARSQKSGKKENFERTRIVVATPADAAPAVKKLKDMGVDFIKIRTWASPEVYFAIARAAREAGIQLVGHGPGFDPVEVAEAGQTGFEHGFFPYPLSKYSAAEQSEIIEAFVRNKIVIVPTFIAWNERLVPLERARAIVADRANKLDPRRQYAAPSLVAYWGKQLEPREPLNETGLKAWTNALETMAGDVRTLYQQGVPVMPGTDLATPLVYPGFSLHDELEMFVEKLGMTPLQALESATRVPAEFMGMKECLGTIEPGKIADLVLLEADPLTDITNTRKIAGVIAGGRYFDKKRLRRILRGVSRSHRLSGKSSMPR